MMKIPAELKELAQIFKDNKKTLYIVGGYVRDGYLGVQSVLRDDIDLCSNATPAVLKKILKGTKFEVKNINERVGVVAIVGKRRYEHATFRKEVYESESHSPDQIEFINSLEEDAKRRDFKVNAIYFDILGSSYVDPLGGIDDLKERIITTTRAPKNVFNDDPERILRLVRFACSLGLKIPEEEMYYAKQNSYKIKFISKFRLKAEFEKLITADSVYPELLYTKDAHFKAMILLGELDVWKFILPAVDEIMHSSLEDNHGERIYDHILNCLKNASPKIRLAVLLHDVGKIKTKTLKNNFFGAKEFVRVIVENNIGVNGLGFMKNEVDRVVRTIEGYDFNNLCLASKSTVRKYVLHNYDVIQNIIEIKSVIKNENRDFPKKIRSAEILRKTYNEMVKEKVPFERKDLKIKGDEIIKQTPNLRLENIETLFDRLLEKVALDPKKNNKKDLLVLVNTLINSNRDLFLD